MVRNQLLQVQTRRETLESAAAPASPLGALTSTSKSPSSRRLSGTVVFEDLIKQTSQVRTIAKMQAQQAQWAQLAEQLSRVTGRPVDQLALTQASEWRAHAEAKDMLERSKPLDMRIPGELWALSLRDAWETIVPISHPLNGLNAIKRIKKPTDEVLERIGVPSISPRPPLGAVGGSAADGEGEDGGGGLTARSGGHSTRRRSWMESDFFYKRKEQYRETLQRLAPHDPDLARLYVDAVPLEQRLLAASMLSVTLEDVETHLELSEPQAFAAHAAAKAEAMEKEAVEQAEAEEAAAAEAEAARAAAEAEASVAEAITGPDFRISSDHLLFNCLVGESSRCVLTATNSGTANVYFTWTKQPGLALPHQGKTAADAHFFMAQHTGVLLPGHSTDFVFTFKAVRAGSFSEEWVLTTEPALPGGPLALALRGCAVQEDTSTVRRQAIVSDLEAREKARKVHLALDRILRNVKAPAKRTQMEEGSELVDADSYDGANLALWPPIYHAAETHAALLDVFKKLKAIIQPNADKKAARKPSPGTKSKQKAIAAEGRTYPLEFWTGGVDQLQMMLEDAAIFKPDEAKALAAELEAVKEAACVPVNRHKLNRHVMRQLVTEAVEQLAAGMEALSAKYEEKKAKQEAAAAGGGAIDAASAADATTAATDDGAAAAPGTSSGDDAVEEDDGTVYDEEWYGNQKQAVAAGALAAAMNQLVQQTAKEHAAISEHLASKIAAVDEQLARPDVSGGEREQLCWDKFVLLRKWTRAGCPPPPVAAQSQSQPAAAPSAAATEGKSS